MSEIEWIAWLLVLAGALNWGLVGMFKFDLVVTVFGTNPFIVKLLYVLIGLSGLYWLIKTTSKKT